jgi:glutamine cyclotransferase
VVSGGLYENVWYNHTIDHLTLDSIEVTFMDNSEVSFDVAQVTQMIAK